MSRFASFGLATLFVLLSPSAEPPNRPATVTLARGRVALRYQGVAIVEGPADVRRFSNRAGSKVT